ncbi:MAG: ABC transporter ATP-binding protein [Alphaproteobacteria bacterium]|nr:ABC transporter ATP-binding protein [Alphaproteobacteria bacterium]
MFDIKYEELKNANTKSPLKFYWDCSKGFRRVLVFDIIYSFLMSLSKVLNIVIFSKLIGYFSSISKDEFNSTKVLSYVGLILLIFCLTHLIRYLRETTSEKARSMLSWRARIFAFDYVSNYSLSYLKDQKAGVIAQRIKALGDNMWGLKLSFARITSCLFLIIIPLIFIGNKNTYFMLIVIILGMLSALFSFIISKKSASLNKRTEEKTSKYNGYVADSLTNILLIKMFGEEKNEKKRLDRELKVLQAYENKTAFSVNTIHAIQEILLAIFRVASVILVLYLWRENSINLEGAIALLLLIDDVIPMFSRLMLDITLVRNNVAKLSDSLKVFEAPIDIKNNTLKTLKIKNGEIEFRDISFGYDKNKLVFDKFNLKIKPKEKISIVGKSGGGKSTLVSLLQGNYNLNSGKILIDGKDISKVSTGSLKRNIATISQDNILFHRTIKKNIQYSNLKASNKQINEASKLACADEFIKETPLGYNTITGERGVKLSGGQRQRVAIARAILKDAPILILDEATSALDNKTEDKVIKALDNLMKNRTVIAIAHRLSTLKSMDRIIVVDKGRIIEEGTIDELLNKNGEFKKLWKLQK